VAIDARLVDRLYDRARGGRWRVAKVRFAEALESSAERAFPSAAPDARDLERYLGALHLEDLALACACAAGDEEAWEHFVREHRPVLYRAADAIEPGGGARDLADSLYADLFGLRESAGERQSLFRYFHGRSSLATWLRAVLAQRHVDRLRTSRRAEELPDDESAGALRAPQAPIDPDRHRYLELIRRALAHIVSMLPARDRLRLACYYARELTLAETGRILGEHEATSSRQLTRTRKVIRDGVELQLRVEHGLTEAEIARCFESVTDDAGPLDLREILEVQGAQNVQNEDPGRKKSALDRSQLREDA
jgi:RNA polymerase sigma-70 factor, ECF subfamily